MPRSGHVPHRSDPPPTYVLLVEDNLADARLLTECLADVENRAYEVHHVTRLQEAQAWLAAHHADVVVLDLGLPDSEGIDTLRGIRNLGIRAPIMVLTGSEDMELEGRLLRAGAGIYVGKGRFSGALLPDAIEYALAHSRLDDERPPAR